MSLTGRLRDYLSLTKPRIVLLVLITAYTAVRVAAGRELGWPLLLLTIAGTALAAASANALNCYIDRDIDALMRRTRRRPLPAGRLSPRSALWFGLALGILAVGLLGAFVNGLAAGLALAGILFYVLVYTVWLKRLTPQNIVIGGAAGAVGPLIGWAAAAGRLDWPAVVLFGIIFLWTPPHFWALALFRRDDYLAAGIPMLPVVAGEAATRRHILRYSVALVACSLLLYPLGAAGGLYLGAAAIAGAYFLLLALRVARDTGDGAAVQLYRYSIVYLAVVFLALTVDPAI